MYAAWPVASEASSASDTARLAEAMSSSRGPRPLGPSPSTTMRTTRRRPAGRTSRASSSSPKLLQDRRHHGLDRCIPHAVAPPFDPVVSRSCRAVASRPATPEPGASAGQPSEHSEAAQGLGYLRPVPDVTTAPVRRWARRDVLRLGLAVPVLAGCSASPTVAPRPGPPGAGTSAPPTPGAASPAPAPAVPAAATAEQALSVYAAAILTGPHRKDVDGDLRRLLTFLRDAHADHAVALAGDDPTTRPTTAAPSPSAGPPDLAKVGLGTSLARLARHEAAQANAQRRAATAATGLTALLAGSLAVAADSYAAALEAKDPPSVSAKKARKPAALLSDVAATQQLVAQLHAVVFGYQLAIGKLKYASGARKRAVSELAATRRLLDTQIAFLLEPQGRRPARRAGVRARLRRPLGRRRREARPGHADPPGAVRRADPRRRRRREGPGAAFTPAAEHQPHGPRPGAPRYRPGPAGPTDQPPTDQPLSHALVDGRQSRTAAATHRRSSTVERATGTALAPDVVATSASRPRRGRAPRTGPPARSAGPAPEAPSARAGPRAARRPRPAPG